MAYTIIYYSLFPYDFYREKKQIAWLSVSEEFIKKLQLKYPKIILKEIRVPFKDAYVIYDKNISDIPYESLIQMLYAWAGGNDGIKKVVNKDEFEKELERLSNY
ncbi:MAG: hypothetical protein LBQ28_04725 [Prevotellaceae bacterium]|jgi:hypothetical protein|nr:hypothetical protein [Prevotellaceae bacterium]